MKNKTISKIMLLALSVAILIGCAFAFSASAEETTTATSTKDMILSQNIVYGDKVAMAYAVNVPVADYATVNVQYYWEGETVADLKSATPLNINVNANLYEKDGVKYPVFITEGVAAKELGKVAYVTTDGGATYITYSAAEYLYVRLYEDGFAAKTEADGLDNNRKLLYQNLLNYGAQAQIVLGYQDEDNLVTNYSFIYSNKAGVSFDGKEYFFGYGEHTISATYSGKGEPKGWTLTDKDGNTTPYETSTFTVKGVYEVSPVIHECIDANSDGMCDVCKTYTFEFTTNGCVSFAQFSTESNSSSRKYLYQTSVSTNAPTYPNFGSSGQLIADPEDASNLVLRWALNNGVKDNGTCYGTTTTVPDAGDGVTSVSTSTIKFAPSEVKEGGNIHILEMDFNLREFGKNEYNSQSSPFRLYAYNSDGEKIGDFYKTASSTGSYNGFVYIDQTNYIYNSTAKTYTLDTNDANAYHFGNHSSRASNRTDASDLVMFDRNEWYRFRFVWDVSTNSIGFEVSFDDGKNWYLCAAYTTANAITEGEEIAYLGFQVDTIYRIGFDILLDDVTYKVVDAHTRATEYGKDSVEASYGK